MTAFKFSTKNKYVVIYFYYLNEAQSAELRNKVHACNGHAVRYACKGKIL